MNKFLGLVIFIFLLVFIPYSYYLSVISKPIGDSSEKVSFEITPGEGVKKIGFNLIEDGMISSQFFFETYIWREKVEKKLQAGTYELNKGMSIVDIVEKFIAGNVLNQERDIKILEGWTINNIEEYLAKNDISQKEEFLSLTTKPVSDWGFQFEKPSFLDSVPAGVDLEGYLFPDTYRIFLDASPSEIIEKLLDNFDQKLSQELRDEIAAQGKSIHEIITLASIIEKEVAVAEDMALVSGILNKRMKIGMRLEVDSSINYISGKNDHSATYEDLQIDSPYNTYQNDGLPPGPICSPGLQAILAAIRPQESPYLFYLNRQDTGETIFSKNFDEHIRNKNKYLK